ncbi:MAG: hypothetical protein JXJ19_00465 [Elusimicrobia bacterium]|nr:hypothetical protein [Elusimicrobiota bacterium]
MNKKQLYFLIMALMLVPAGSLHAGKDSRWRVHSSTDMEWATETVCSEGSCGKYASLDIDSDNNIHVAFWNESDHSIQYLRRDSESGEWDEVRTGPFQGDVYGYISIALDNNGKPHIAFTEKESTTDEFNIRHCDYDGNSWGSDGVAWGDVNPRRDTSIAVDNENYIYISYYWEAPAGGLGYLTNYGGAWSDSQATDAFSDRGMGTSIGIDDNFDVYIAHFNLTVAPEKVDCRRKNRGTANDFTQWVQIDGYVDDAPYMKGRTTCMAFNKTGDKEPHLVYLNDTDDEIVYAFHAGDHWVKKVVCENGGEDHISIDVEGLDEPHIAFCDGYDNDGSLKYARYFDEETDDEDSGNKNGEFWIETVDKGPEAGRYPSIKIDPEGMPYIAYYDGENTNLKFAYLKEKEKEEDDEDRIEADLKEEDEVIVGNNKFDPSNGGKCRIMYRLAKDQGVTIKIYDLTGNLVKTVIDKEVRGKGAHGEDEWDGMSMNKYVTPGIYYVVVEGEGWQRTAKVAVFREKNSND